MLQFSPAVPPTHFAPSTQVAEELLVHVPSSNSAILSQCPSLLVKT